MPWPAGKTTTSGKDCALAGRGIPGRFGQLQERMLEVSAQPFPFSISGGYMNNNTKPVLRSLAPAQIFAAPAAADAMPTRAALAAHQQRAAALEAALVVMRVRGVGA